MSLNTILATTPLTSTNYVLKATGTTIGNSSIYDNGTNVGIGNTNTSYTLDVSGTGRFTSTLLVSGNVGIGVTPSSQAFAGVQSLQIMNSLYFGYLNRANVLANAYVTSSGALNYIATDFATRYEQFDGKHQFSTAPSGTAATAITFTPRLLIDNSGNVGIANTAPIFPLHISASYSKTTTSGSAQMFISTNEAAASNPFGLRFQVFGGAAIGNRYAVLQTTDYNSADGGSIVLQSGGGNVGINNTTPSTYLDVSNNGTNNNAYITTRNTGINGYRSGAIFTNSAAGGLSWYLVSTNNGDGDWGGGKFAISTNNAVGVYLNGSTATTWTGQSDIRLKDIDSEIENAIDKVNKLRGVRFTWKSDETKKMQVGLIAQEVKEVLPEAVDFDETNEDYRMGVQYTDLIPLLVNAIKEQQIQIQNLQEQINILAK